MDDPKLRWWRRGAVSGLLILAGLPLLAPFVDLWYFPQAWAAFAEAGRMAELASTTVLLLVGTITLALPVGTALGLLLFRTDLPGAGFWRFLFLASLFLPLPLVVSGWQMTGQFFHAGSLLDTSIGFRLFFGAVLHALLALPWVLLITGLGFLWVEPELEEDALLAAPALHVFWRVTLPRNQAALGMAALIIALFCWSEITLTDFLRLPTYGEEVYTQLVASNDTEVARAVAVSIPALLVLLPLTMSTLSRWKRSCPPRLHVLRSTRIFALGKWRWPALGFVLVMLLLILGVPLFGLLWKAGLRYASAEAPGPPVWEAGLVRERFWEQWQKHAALWLEWDQKPGFSKKPGFFPDPQEETWHWWKFQLHSGMLVDSVFLGLVVGLLASSVALILAWLMRHNTRMERGLWCLAAALWAMPGPLLGLGLLTFLQWLFVLPGGEALKPLFWSRPSPLPNIWICLLRFGPIALAVLWPLVRQLPQELEEAAALDGAWPWQRFYLVILPALWRPALWAALIVATLTLGEISASKMVTTPGYTPLAHHVFQQMHAGADTELAALCLVLLAGVAVGGILVAAVRPRPSHARSAAE